MTTAKELVERVLHDLLGSSVVAEEAEYTRVQAAAVATNELSCGTVVAIQRRVEQRAITQRGSATRCTVAGGVLMISVHSGVP